jgi:hypothetical protein
VEIAIDSVMLWVLLISTQDPICSKRCVMSQTVHSSYLGAHSQDRTNQSPQVDSNGTTQEDISALEPVGAAGGVDTGGGAGGGAVVGGDGADGAVVVIVADEMVFEPATGTFVALNADVSVVAGKGAPEESGRT